MDMFIDGGWRRGVSGARHDVVNPATGAVVDTDPPGSDRRGLESALRSADPQAAADLFLQRAHVAEKAAGRSVSAPLSSAAC